MQVTLLTFTPEAEHTIAAAAILSTSRISAGEIREGLNSEHVNSLLDRLISSGHLSPSEHAGSTFAIDGISCATSHQLIRHRLANYAQQSQRYVSFREVNHVTPSVVIAEGFRAKFREIIEPSYELYWQMIDTVLCRRGGRLRNWQPLKQE